jgi:hypothetical protein
MPAWLVAVLAKVAEFELPKLWAWLKGLLAKQEAASKMSGNEDANLKNYDNAVKTGNLDEQAKTGEALLDGSDSKP